MAKWLWILLLLSASVKAAYIDDVRDDNWGLTGPNPRNSTWIPYVNSYVSPFNTPTVTYGAASAGQYHGITGWPISIGARNEHVFPGVGSSGGYSWNYSSAVNWTWVGRDASNSSDTNTRIEVKNVESWALRASDNVWVQLNATNLPDGGIPLEAGGSCVPYTSPNIRTEADGGRSAKLPNGCGWHFYGSRITYSTVYKGFASRFDARLVLDNAGGTDDRATAKYMMTAGADWWKSIGQGGCPMGENPATACNMEIGASRSKYITSNWQTVTFSSATAADNLAYPLPNPVSYAASPTPTPTPAPTPAPLDPNPAKMVQSNTFVTHTGASGSTTLSAPAINSKIYVPCGVSAFITSDPVVTDSLGNTYTKIVSNVNTLGRNAGYVATISVTPAPTPVPITVTCTPSVASAIDMAAFEISGVATVGPVNFGTMTGASPYVWPSVTTTAPAIIIGSGRDTGQTSSTNVWSAGGLGWQLVPVNTDGINSRGYMTLWASKPISGTYSPSAFETFPPTPTPVPALPDVLANTVAFYAPTPAPGDYEAELCTYTGNARFDNNNPATGHSGYSYSGFVDGLWLQGGISCAVTASSAGNYTANLTYSNGLGVGGTARTLRVFVNGFYALTTTLPATTNWDAWATKSETLTLTTGANTIAYVFDASSTGNVNLDKFSLASVVPTPTPTPTPTPPPLILSSITTNLTAGSHTAPISASWTLLFSNTLNIDTSTQHSLTLDTGDVCSWIGGIPTPSTTVSCTSTIPATSSSAHLQVNAITGGFADSYGQVLYSPTPPANPQVSVQIVAVTPTPSPTPTPAPIHTYYVAKTGSNTNDCTAAQTITTPKQTLTNAVGCLSAGSKLVIRDGVYTENLENAIPGGSSGLPVTVESYPGETVTLRPPSGSDRVLYFSTSASSYINIRNLILDGVNVNYEVVKVTASAAGNYTQYITLDGVEIMNAEHTAIGGTHQHGVLLSGGLTQANMGHNTLKNCKIHDNGTDDFSHGIYLSASSYNIIQGNDFYNNAGYGIHMYDEGDGNVNHDNQVIGNRSHNNARIGNRGDGIIIGGGNNNLVANNLVYSNHPSAGNDGGIRVQFQAPTGTQIINNTIWDNNVGLEVAADAVNTLVKNNIVFGNSVSQIVNSGTGTTLTTNITTDPYFLSTAPVDINFLKIGESSNAFDAGTTDATVTTDILGTSRPQSIAYDIGAFEALPANAYSAPTSVTLGNVDLVTQALVANPKEGRTLFSDVDPDVNQPTGCKLTLTSATTNGALVKWSLPAPLTGSDIYSPSVSSPGLIRCRISLAPLLKLSHNRVNWTGIVEYTGPNGYGKTTPTSFSLYKQY